MKTFIFRVYKLVPGTTCHYLPEEVEKVAASFTAALALLTESHPHHNVAEHVRGAWRIKGEEHDR